MGRGSFLSYRLFGIFIFVGGLKKCLQDNFILVIKFNLEQRMVCQLYFYGFVCQIPEECVDSVHLIFKSMSIMYPDLLNVRLLLLIIGYSGVVLCLAYYLIHSRCSVNILGFNCIFIQLEWETK